MSATANQCRVGVPVGCCVAAYGDVRQVTGDKCRVACCSVVAGISSGVRGRGHSFGR